MKQAQTAPPDSRARTHFPWSTWPRPGTSQPAIPISQARGGAFSKAVCLSATVVNSTSVVHLLYRTTKLRRFCSTLKRFLNPHSDAYKNLTSDLNRRRYDL